jgi:hypothetical protein
MWLREFEIAIIEKNSDEIERLLDLPLKFDTLNDAKMALSLLEEAIKFLNEAKNETAVTMMQMKKNIDFLKSTATITHSSLDIRS